MMEEELLAERPGLPAVHPRGGDRNPVHPSRRVGNVTAHFLETCPPEQLTPAGHVVFTLETVAARVISGLAKHRSRHAEFRRCLEATGKEFEVIRLEREIRVEISDDVEIEVTDALEPMVE